MRLMTKMMATGAVGFAAAIALLLTVHALSAAPQPYSAMMTRSHRVVIQISEDDPKTMNVALNNAENLTHYFEARDEPIQIEFVMYGPGLDMLRSDTSPVKARLENISHTMKNITFSGCGNTLEKDSKALGRKITLVPEARLVPTGIARIVQLEEQGWTYVRP